MYTLEIFFKTIFSSLFFQKIYDKEEIFDANFGCSISCVECNFVVQQLLFPVMATVLCSNSSVVCRADNNALLRSSSGIGTSSRQSSKKKDSSDGQVCVTTSSDTSESETPIQFSCFSQVARSAPPLHPLALVSTASRMPTARLRM